MVARYVGLFIGVWYVVAPFAWSQLGGYQLGFNWWNDLVVGAAVLALSGSFLLGWSRTAAWLLVAVGAYSMAAPFLHGYLPDSFAYWNDLVFGVLVVGTGAALGAAAVEYGGASAPAGAETGSGAGPDA